MVVWTRGVNRNIFNNKGNIKKLNYKKPIWIYVGRIAVEKNIEKFLELKLPGTKLLIGDGPQLKTLKEKSIGKQIFTIKITLKWQNI